MQSQEIVKFYPIDQNQEGNDKKLSSNAFKFQPAAQLEGYKYLDMAFGRWWIKE